MLSELTATELKVAKEMTKCIRRQEVADNLFMSIDSVKRHLKNIYLKLNISNEMQLVMLMACDALGKKFSAKDIREKGVTILLSITLIVMACRLATPDSMRRMPRRSGRRIEVVDNGGIDYGDD